METANGKIVMYGTAWCGDCRRARAVMERLGVSYQYIDLDQNPEAVKVVERINNGYRSVPTIIFPDGSVLVEPSNHALSAKLATV